MRTISDDRRSDWLAQEDPVLLADCHVDTYRASGPGGQKRNKTSSAVRLRHRPSGLRVIAEESRSQHENKARALRRLRMAIALRVRQPIKPHWQPPDGFLRRRSKAGRIEVSRRNPAYPLVVAIVLDALAAQGGRLREAGALLGLSTGQLSRFITADPKLLAAANEIRGRADLRRLNSR